MDELAKKIIKQKIIKIIKAYDFDTFYKINPDYNSFIHNNQLETVMTHIIIENPDSIYSQIKEELSREYNNQNGIEKHKVNVLTENKVAGFVDALILAFITGSFIGIVLLNIYSKIVQNM